MSPVWASSRTARAPGVSQRSVVDIVILDALEVAGGQRCGIGTMSGTQ